jgi:hypothetical protein
MMPPQLARALQRTKPRKYKSTKLVAETLPCFNVNELVHAIPHKYGIVRTQSFTTPSHPPLLGLRLTYETIEAIHRNGNIQKLKIKWIRTGFGHPRPAIHCDKCRRAVTKLYNRFDDLACKHCRGAIYLSQKLNKHTRPALKAYRLARFLELKNNINKRTQERLLRKYGEKAMMPQSNYGTGTARHWK